ncbi:MAG: metallophosphoesterase [Candidatus Bathyarchaeota archaeon B63]|nr:MAG: metallophosphoesterase [Candidatus Bathyarchaeota archaeon B63]
MKLIVGSDFHGDELMVERFVARAEEEHAEAILICGDITNFGTLREATRLLSLFTRLRLPVLFVPGNCDPPSLLGVDLEGVRVLHGEAFSTGGVPFIGVGGSPPTPFHTPFEIREEEIMAKLNHAASRLIDDEGFVLLSHAPPKGTRLDRTRFGLHVGSRSVRRFIEERSPLIVFCGHIHEARGEDRIGETMIINPGPARHGDYASATVGGGEVHVEFHSL